MSEVEDRFWCHYCDTYYAEYVNGCPRCHFGKPGTATSVVHVFAVKLPNGKYRKATEQEADDFRRRRDGESCPCHEPKESEDSNAE